MSETCVMPLPCVGAGTGVRAVPAKAPKAGVRAVPALVFF